MSDAVLRPPRTTQDDARLHRLALVLALGFALAGSLFLVKGLYIHAKAWAAQLLIHRAWSATLQGQADARPWPWADTVPRARLVVPRLGVDQIVLAGASGRNLAFGPAQLDGTAPAGNGVTVIAGHRDTHFAFLRDLKPGDAIELQRADGTLHRFQVDQAAVVPGDGARLPDATADGEAWLVLSTCWPFDAIEPGTPWRYLVTAREANQ